MQSLSLQTNALIAYVGWPEGRNKLNSSKIPPVMVGRSTYWDRRFCCSSYHGHSSPVIDLHIEEQHVGWVVRSDEMRHYSPEWLIIKNNCSHCKLWFSILTTWWSKCIDWMKGAACYSAIGYIKAKLHCEHDKPNTPIHSFLIINVRLPINIYMV